MDFKKNKNYWITCKSIAEAGRMCSKIMNMDDDDVKIAVFKKCIGHMRKEIESGTIMLFSINMPPVDLFTSLLSSTSQEMNCGIDAMRETVDNMRVIMIQLSGPEHLAELTMQGENVASIIYRTWVVVEDGVELSEVDAVKRCKDFAVPTHAPQKRKYHEIEVRKPKKVVKKAAPLKPLENALDVPDRALTSLEEEMVLPEDKTEYSKLLRMHVPTYFTEHNKTGREGLMEDLKNIVPFFNKMILPIRKQANGKTDYTVHDIGNFNSFLSFISYGFVNTLATAKVTRQQMAVAMFDKKMYLRPPVIRNAILKDMNDVNPSVYTRPKHISKYGISNQDLIIAVDDFLNLTYSHVLG